MKKFLVVVLTVLLLCGAAFWAYMEYVRPKNFAVFVTSMKHGQVTVDGYDKTGSDDDFRIIVKNGDNITLNISPEITDSSYYVLSKLLVNGNDVTAEVDMLSYSVRVKSKLSIIAYFKSADRPASIETASKLTMPSTKIKAYNKVNDYLGSAGAYNMQNPSVIYDADSSYYYCFASGNSVSRSEDLVNWENMGTYFKAPSSTEDESIFDFSKIQSVESWARLHGYVSDYTNSSDGYSRVPICPEIIEVDGTYYLYFSIRKDSSKNEAAIFCVKTDDLADAVVRNKWDDVGVVIASYGSDGVCASDPSVFVDSDGRMYMSYGGYYTVKGKLKGGIYLIELDPSTGLANYSSDITTQGAKLSGGDYHSGICVVQPGKIKNDYNIVSSVDLSYVADAGYYYMFVTYGIVGKSESIRVFRSGNVTGPYKDATGRTAQSEKKRNQLESGTKLAGGYSFTSSQSDGVQRNELGRASIGSPCLIKTNNGYVMFAHSGLLDGTSKPALDIRKVTWDENMWPLLSPEIYRGEKTQKVDISEMYGIWDVIVFKKNVGASNIYNTENNESFKTSVFQGVAITEQNIDDNAKLSSLSFETDGDYSFKIKINGEIYKVYAVAAYDSELECNCVVFTGINDDGITVWGKKSISSAAALYTDAFDYALSIADSATREEYEKKFEKLSKSPSQERINTLASNLIAQLLK